ncbi:MAG: GIY-YIG nuclease family protein [Verrucomicrobia bacterium]|nr:GIY-YIG nuclease family protein [Leptolyngbya sp. ES-bin-22]
MEPENTAIEHQNVPQSHQGLHGFLYSSEDEHTAVTTNASSLDAPTEVMPLEDWCHLAGTAKVVGVYAVLGCDRRTHYVGYSRNVALSLKGHAAQLGNDICAFVQVHTFKLPKREVMEQQRDAWIAQLDYVPSGNAEASELWAGTVGEAAIAAMSPAERQAYEEKKLKLRKAMADSELSRDPSSERDAGQQTLGATVENGDWSAVIQEQTQQA